MDQRLMQWIASALLALIASSQVCAQLQKIDTQSQLDDLMRQLNHVEAVNAEVRLELDAAQADLNDGWLDDQRAAQVASLVQEIINHADTRTNLRGDGLMMGWSNGFFLASADGRHRLNVSGMMQARYTASWVGEDNPRPIDDWQSGFDIPRVRFDISGQIANPNMSYLIQAGWGRLDPDHMTNNDSVIDQRLWEVWAKMKIADNLALKVGQFKLPFTRETLVDASRQLAIEKSLVDHRLGLEMSTGVELVWSNRDRRFFLAFTNGSGALLWSNTIFNKPTTMPPWPALSRDTSYSFTLRHEWKLSGNWEQFNQFTSPPGKSKGTMIGVAGHRQNLERESEDVVGGFPDGTAYGLTADLSLLLDGASFFVSGTYHHLNGFQLSSGVETMDWYGIVAQGGTYVTNSTELYGRVEVGGLHGLTFISSTNTDLQIMTVGMNHYLDGQDMKLSADVGYSFGEVTSLFSNSLAGWRADAERHDQVVIRTQLQVMF